MVTKDHCLAVGREEGGRKGTQEELADHLTEMRGLHCASPRNAMCCLLVAVHPHSSLSHRRPDSKHESSPWKEELKFPL